MKSDTTTTNKSKTHDEILHFKSRDIYNDFVSKKRIYKSLGKKPKDRVVPYSLYSRIIKRFLTIYFYEVFYLDKPFFFFLGGKVKRCRISKFFLKDNRFINEAVSFIWFLRPHPKLYLHVRVDIMRGEKNPMSLIRKEFSKKNDLGLLPLKNNMLIELKNKNLMFRKYE